MKLRIAVLALLFAAIPLLAQLSPEGTAPLNPVTGEFLSSADQSPFVNPPTVCPEGTPCATGDHCIDYTGMYDWISTVPNFPDSKGHVTGSHNFGYTEVNKCSYTAGPKIGNLYQCVPTANTTFTSQSASENGVTNAGTYHTVSAAHTPPNNAVGSVYTGWTAVSDGDAAFAVASCGYPGCSPIAIYFSGTTPSFSPQPFTSFNFYPGLNYCPAKTAPLSSPIVVLRSGRKYANAFTNVKDGVQFNFFGDGDVQMAWTKSGTDAAFLVWDSDRNGDGVFDAYDMFGNLTKQRVQFAPNGDVLASNGFAALKLLDKNHDGKLTGKELKHLRLWVDSNHDGIKEDNEVLPLSEFGITSISTKYTVTARSDQFGNLLRFKGTAIQNGLPVTIYDVIFRVK